MKNTNNRNVEFYLGEKYSVFKKKSDLIFFYSEINCEDTSR